MPGNSSGIVADSRGVKGNKHSTHEVGLEVLRINNKINPLVQQLMEKCSQHSGKIKKKKDLGIFCKSQEHLEMVPGLLKEGDSCVSPSGYQEIQIPAHVPDKSRFFVPHCPSHSEAEG